MIYHDFLIRIKNAARAGKETVLAPYSTLNLSIAKILVAEGYLKSADKRVIGRKNYVEVTVAYEGKQPVLTDFKFISKPSRHLYGGYRDLKPVRQHFGTAVLSTPKGVLTAKDARKEKVGGEYLFEIW
jgi:small subunit ribosomal protein S8